MTGKVILATLILFAPFFLACIITMVVEGTQQARRLLDHTDRKSNTRVIRSLERSLR